MGKGKGSHNIWVAPIRKGQIICEVVIFFLDKLNTGKKALRSGGSKLSLKTDIISNMY
jgi:ribosomal protein L16/L10AE